MIKLNILTCLCIFAFTNMVCSKQTKWKFPIGLRDKEAREVDYGKNHKEEILTSLTP